jgi:hypothetical protein
LVFGLAEGVVVEAGREVLRGHGLGHRQEGAPELAGTGTGNTGSTNPHMGSDDTASQATWPDSSVSRTSSDASLRPPDPLS